MDDLICREDVLDSLRKLRGVGGMYLWDPEAVMDAIEKVPESEEAKELRARIAELETQVVRMRYHDSQITQRRVFEIEFSKLLDPEEAMDIFVRNMKRIFERSDVHGR